MNFNALVKVLDETVAQLKERAPGVNFVVIATDDAADHLPDGNELTLFRNTAMTDDQCLNFCNRASSMAAFGKGIFIKAPKA